jgi:hypothetical protein
MLKIHKVPHKQLRASLKILVRKINKVPMMHDGAALATCAPDWKVVF